jgi:DNA-binding transcriptional MerR regulator
LIQSKQVLKLTGLSADQLRDWTHRRALIEPDVKPTGPGTRALYSWQTVLVLRLAVVLRDRFHIELQAHRELFGALRALLTGTSFPALEGCLLALYDMRRCEVLSTSNRGWSSVSEDVVLLRLDPHLDVLSAHFDALEPSPQLPLFRAVQVR